jgi:hypothetical protein
LQFGGNDADRDIEIHDFNRNYLGFNSSTVLFLDTGVEVDEIPLVNEFDGLIDVVIVF